MIDAKVKDGRLSVDMTGAPATIMADMTLLLASVCRNIGNSFSDGTAEEKKAVSCSVLGGIFTTAREVLDRQPDSEIMVKMPTKVDGEA